MINIFIIRYFVLFILYLLCIVFAVAQDDSPQTVFSYEAFMEQVKTQHPVAIQAGLLIDQGEAYLMKSRGAFDPKAYVDAAEKDFDGKDYYSLVNAGLKIPTWFGVELMGSYTQTQGEFLNPENYTPGMGLVTAGLSVTAGRGLFIDQRRAALRQAKILQLANEAERRQMLNQLLYEAGKVYWEWFMMYGKTDIYAEGYRLAQVRLAAVKQGVKFGDRPAIDTLEAGIQVQNRQLDLQQARLELVNSQALLSIYLWEEGLIPLEVAEGTVPISLGENQGVEMNQGFLDQLEPLIEAHPDLQLYRAKLQHLAVDRRLKREQLKPTVNLKYNAINQPLSGNPFTGYSPENYTWGLVFEMPLLLRKERGDLQLAEIKIKNTQLEQDNKREALMFKARASLNEWATTRDQLTLYAQNVQDYAALLSGERQLFQTGESSLFMVNSRESSYIKAQVKLVEVLTKNRKAELGTRYSLGILP